MPIANFFPNADPCLRCKRSIAVPGLDASFCSGCGWVEGRSIVEQISATSKKSKSRKRQLNVFKPLSTEPPTPSVRSRSRKYCKKILSAATERPITLDNVAELLDMSYPSAKRYVKRLVETGELIKLQQSGGIPNLLYTPGCLCPPIVPSVSDRENAIVAAAIKKPITWAEAAEALGLRSETTRKYLNQLVRSGKLIKRSNQFSPAVWYSPDCLNPPKSTEPPKRQKAEPKPQAKAKQPEAKTAALKISQPRSVRSFRPEASGDAIEKLIQFLRFNGGSAPCAHVAEHHSIAAIESLLRSGKIRRVGSFPKSYQLV